MDQILAKWNLDLTTPKQQTGYLLHNTNITAITPPKITPHPATPNKNKTKTNAQKQKSKTSSGVVHGYFSSSFCFKPRHRRPTWYSTAAGHASRLVCSGSLCDIKVTPCNAVQLRATCKCRRTGAVPSPVPWGTVAANHRADWQSAQAYSMVACTYVAPWTDVWLIDLYWNGEIV